MIRSFTVSAPPAALLDAECRHTIAVLDGETQHHEIRDDGAPHSPTGECGCGPQRYLTGGQIVYKHVDQDLC